MKANASNIKMLSLPIKIGLAEDDKLLEKLNAYMAKREIRTVAEALRSMIRELEPARKDG